MKCHTPDCTGEHEAREISHSIVYGERTVVIHRVPANVCPECGDAVLAEVTTIHLEGFLKRKARAKGDAFVYEI